MEKILNVGCGENRYGTHFVDKYPLRPEIKKCDLDCEKLPFKDNFFDEVVGINVLEHLTNMGFALKELHRVMKKGGKLTIQTDNANYWGYAISKSHLGGYEDRDYFRSSGGDKHYALFTTSHLWNLAKKVGFKNIKVGYVKESPEGSYVRSNLRFQNIRKLVKLIAWVALSAIPPLYRMKYGSLKLECVK